jgi:two-component system, NarL family, response regulator DevR
LTTSSLTRRGFGVLVVATEPLMRAGISTLLADGGAGTTVLAKDGQGALDSGPTLMVVDTVGSIEAAERAFGVYVPLLSILVLDPILPGTTLEDACTRLITSQPNTRAVVILGTPDSASVRRICGSGARAVFSADIAPRDLVTALGQVAAGEVVVQPSLVKYLIEGDGGAAGKPERNEVCNRRELTALQLLARGYSSKQIAPLLATSAKAVDMLVERATRRLGATARAQAVAIALRRGLIV